MIPTLALIGDTLLDVEIEPKGFQQVIDLIGHVRRFDQRMFFIGNGASASIASHMAADWLKTVGIAAQCFNDAPLMTAISNDIRYDQVFARPLAVHCRSGDVLFAISSSGQSASILNAAGVARSRGMHVVTLSGFLPDNPLRGLGLVNFYVPSKRYGVVEVCHHAICHAILDEVAGVTEAA